VSQIPDKYTLNCTCGMTHTAIISKIAYWYEDHRGDCPTPERGFSLTSTNGVFWSGTFNALEGN
jgi:hypothetical protein